MQYKVTMIPVIIMRSHVCLAETRNTNHLGVFSLSKHAKQAHPPSAEPVKYLPMLYIGIL